MTTRQGHPPGVNWANKTIWTGDNLEVMRGMNSESVDLIYLDPPFNSKTDYAAPIGSQAAGAAFKDTWTLTDLDVAWLDLIEAKHPDLWRVIQAAMVPSDKSYLVYMAVRLIELRRVMKDTGSIYLHCDPTMSHYLKLVMDAIFGRSNFRNEIVWRYPKYSPGTKAFGRDYDQILFYAGSDSVRITPQKIARDEPVRQLVRENVGGVLKNKRDPETGKVMYRTSTTKNVASVWDISLVMPASKERTGYPTQKPLKLLERIIRASSNEGDVVFDPFCGCATTLVAADDLGRSWAGIDISPKAADLVVERIEERQGLFHDIVHRTDIPRRTDLGPLPAANSAENRQRLYGEQGGYCAGCGEHFQSRHLEVDHYIARSKGSTDHIDNLQLLCGHCNRTKGNRGMEYLRAKLRLAS